MPLEFEKLSLDRQDEYHAALEQCPQLMTSDFAFANVWGWAQHYKLEWAFHNDHVFIRQNSGDKPLYWAPIGPWHEYKWPGCNAMRDTGHFIRVPEYLAKLWGDQFGDEVDIQETRDHWDYVYSVEELTNLSGNKFHKKKNLLNQFKKKYDYDYSPMGPECVEEVLAMQLDWLRWFEEHNPSASLVAENTAITRVLHDFDCIDNLMGAAIRVDGKVVAYTVAEPLDDDSVVIHFEKGNIQYKGVYQAINQMFLEHDCQDFKYVNREQDMGEEGLRKAKLSYNPAMFLKKYEAVIK